MEKKLHERLMELGEELNELRKLKSKDEVTIKDLGKLNAKLNTEVREARGFNESFQLQI